MSSNRDILQTATSYLGKLKYVFGSDDIEGGTGDCSSYTEYVFSVHGFTIGADTSAQYTQGLPVGRENIQPGDLVFFKNTYDSHKIDGVSHVGIALSNDTFIHLVNQGCIISNLNESYWKEHYLDARRVNGLTYSEVGGFDVSGFDMVTEENENATGETELKWWGDIVRIVVIVLVILGMIIFLILGVGKDIVLEVGQLIATKKGGTK